MSKYGSMMLKRPSWPTDRMTREHSKPSPISYNLHSSILQHVCPIHSADFQAVVTNARDFKAAELEANYAQAINLLSTAAPIHLSAAVLGNLLAPTNSNTAAELISKQNPKTEIDTPELEIVDEDASPNNLETNQKQLPTNNIPPVIVINDKSLTAIFLFELKETTPVPLFSRATLDTKPITAMYTDTKVDGHVIKLILDNRSAGSIIT
ncbi:hypothetical protein G9A89_003316 [Geosiphon pyriformis]|nr:hypothetical protein G9A89_003316 [Geosiphon pyriformis]